MHDTWTIHRQYVRYADNTCATRTRCSVFTHTSICKHVLVANHLKEKRRPEAERRQSLNMKALAKPLYVAKGKSEKGTRRGGGKGYRMKTAALIPQLAVGKSIGCRGHAKKTNKPAKTITKALKVKVSSKSKASKSKSKPEPKTTTKTKAKASKAPAPLRTAPYWRLRGRVAAASPGT